MKFNVYGMHNDTNYCETAEIVIQYLNVSLEALARTIQFALTHINVQWAHVTKVEDNDTTSPPNP